MEIPYLSQQEIEELMRMKVARGILNSPLAFEGPEYDDLIVDARRRLGEDVLPREGRKNTIDF